MSANSGLRPGADGKLPKLAEPKTRAIESPSINSAKEGASEHSELHSHGDGSYHTMHGGAQEEHPSLGHALMHLAGKHEPEGKHMHVKHDGMISSHHVAHGGGAEGPHDHENIDALKQHMDQFLSEEAAEKGGSENEESNEGEGLKGFGG
jgi:hypothetical protein